jgi:hypothetical protein
MVFSDVPVTHAFRDTRSATVWAVSLTFDADRQPVAELDAADIEQQQEGEHNGEFRGGHGANVDP